VILTQVLIGSAGIAGSVAIQAGFMMALLAYARGRPPPASTFGKSIAISGVVVWFFLAACAVSWMWAMVLLWLGGFETLEAALYFATVSFTTVGYGDLVLEDRWRLLGSFIAANGMIIFGWTTALVFIAVQRIYQDVLDP